MFWGHVSIWGYLGSQGSKGHFHLKCYNSSMLHSMTIRLKHVDKLETIYLCYRVRCQSGVIWGHWGQKVNSIKCFNLPTFNSMTRKLIHEHQHETYLQYGVKCQSGVILGSIRQSTPSVKATMSSFICFNIANVKCHF